MKLDDAVALGAEDVWQEAQVRVSPGDRSEWFVMLRDRSNKSFILADNDDRPIATDNLNSLVQMMRWLGLKDFTVFL